MFLKTLLFSLSLVGFFQSGIAQSSLTGTVVDWQQNIKPGCKLNLKNTGLVTTTDNKGVFTFVGATDIIPLKFDLMSQPIIKANQISYFSQGRTVVELFGIKGQRIQTLQDKMLTAGDHTLNISESYSGALEPGFYVIKIKSEALDFSGKILYSGKNSTEKYAVNNPINNGNSNKSTSNTVNALAKQAAGDTLIVECTGSQTLTKNIPDINVALGKVQLSKPPNIVFVLTDDQGWGDTEKTRHPFLKTPNINKLWDESVSFNNFYVSPSCSPTRAALLTGMHEFRNGVTHTVVPREHLDLKATIFPELLQKVGYKTALIGKWHLAYDLGHAPWARPGFDYVTQTGSTNHFDPEMATFAEKNTRVVTKGFREDLFTDSTMAFMERNHKAGLPFFAMLATFSPHTPLAAPEEFIAPFRGKVATDDQAVYLGMVANIEYNVGRLMKKIDDLGIGDSTIVIMMNDNGATEGLDVWNDGMRGAKTSVWQGGTRAFSLWHWPKHWAPHEVSTLTAHLDLLPTLMQAAGVTIPADLKPKLEGFDLTQELESKGNPIPANRLLFQHRGRWESGTAAEHKYHQAAVRKGDYLLVNMTPCENWSCCQLLRNVIKGGTAATYTAANAQFHWMSTPANKPWALYDIRKDPKSLNDLYDQEPALVKEMSDAYEKWWDGMYPQMIAAGGDAGVI